MYLKSLTLKGFKSFADRTQLAFDPGLTVVVGPNGSGKSNISDAVLWVLGEQSAKALRGQAMEDVIFSGSSGRRAVGIAEVTIVLDNEDRTLPIDFSEVAITRRMYRSGESEYLINQAPSRLRDIQDILHDSGLGKETHSIISQGKLDAILSSRPEERRELIEEAAGISKHRRRKERSERRMQSMQENLTRAKDVQREVQRQLRPLERQADKARRQKEAAGRLSRIEAELLVDDLRQLQAGYERLEGRGREAEAAIELARFRLDERNAELGRYQSLLEQKGIFVGDLGEQRRRTQDVLGRLDADMRLLEEKGRNMVSRLSDLRMSLSSMERQSKEARAELDQVVQARTQASVRAQALRDGVAKLEPEAREVRTRYEEQSREASRLEKELRAAQHAADAETLAYARLSDQISNAEVEDQMFASRLAQLADGLATTREALDGRVRRRTELEGLLAAARDAQDGASGAVRSSEEALAAAQAAERKAREELSHAEALLSALEDVDAQAEGSNELVQALATRDADMVLCRLADLFEAPQELEGLVESLLGEDVAALVTSGTGDVARLVSEALGLGETGRATLVSLDGTGDVATQDAPGTALTSRLSIHEGAEGLIEALLGRVRIVAGASEALAAHATNPSFCYVCPDGVAVLPDGRTIVGRGKPSGAGTLGRKRQIRGLAEGMEGLETAARQAHDALVSAESALGAARDEAARAKGEAARLAAELSTTTSEVGRLEEQIRKAESEEAQVIKARAAAAERASKATQEVERHKAAADEATRKVRELTQSLDELSRERGRTSEEMTEKEGELSRQRLELATLTERLSHMGERKNLLERQLGRLEVRRREAERTADSLDVLRLRVQPLHERYEALRGRALAWAARLKDRASLAEADSDSLKKTIAEAREAVSRANNEVESATAALADVKVERGRLEVQVEAAVDSIVSRGFVLDEVLALPPLEDRSRSEEAAERLRQEIASIGAVNEVAMDEYLRLKERYDYMSAQMADLEAASKALARITAAIERKMRRRFMVVFEAVNKNFGEVFSLLFPGGQAHLEMSDPDHVDRTGIEIVAQPRGKRIQKMSLMSGGERSLTALALLFAVYKTRTVPFYVFDEVEAALDDSNLSKLLDAIESLKESTQLIVITHQRRTMECADVLYGVSMQADGVSHVVSQRLEKGTERKVNP